VLRHSLAVSRPSLESFGLNPDAVARIERRERTLYGNLHYVGIAAGTVAAIGVGYLLGDLRGAASFGILGPFLGGYLGATWLDSQLRSRDPELQRYESYTRAAKNYDLSLWQEEQRQKRAQAEFWRSLSGHSFERELAALLRRSGLNVEQTRGSGDGGIDLIIRQPHRTTVVQCKQTKHPVGPAAARDLFGALQHHGYDAGILAATAGVTSGVRTFFEGKPLSVMDLDAILKLQRDAEPKTS
jgi:hypothetical protein